MLGINVFFLKIQINTETGKFSNYFKTVNRVSCKPTNRLCNNPVYLTALTVFKQLFKTFTLIDFRAANTLVKVKPRILSAGIRLNIVFVMLLLHF